MPIVTVYFEGLCAFQNATPYLNPGDPPDPHYKVYIPRAHGHNATLVARVEGIELSPEPGKPGHDPTRWKPRLMFRQPGTNELHYLWDIQAPVHIGTRGLPALAGDQDLVMNLRDRHPGCKFKGSAHGLHIELRGGEIRPFEDSRTCFLDEADIKVYLAEVLFWRGAISTITSGRLSIKVKADASFVISNTNPEPNGVAHMSAYYDLFLQKMDTKPNLELEFCESERLRRSVDSGNCVPDGIIP